MGEPIDLSKLGNLGLGDPNFCFQTLVRWVPEDGNSSRSSPQRGFISRNVALRGELLTLLHYTRYSLNFWEYGLSDSILISEEEVNLEKLSDKVFLHAVHFPWCHVQYVARFKATPSWEALERLKFLGASNA